MLEKDAGGEILGGVLGALTRPFVGAAKSTAVRNKVVGGLTKHVNEPLERLLHRAGVGSLIEPGFYAASRHRNVLRSALQKAHSAAMLPFPIDPAQRALYSAGRAEELVAPHFADYAQRSAYAKRRAGDVIKTISDHPDAAAFSALTTVAAPIPGITEAYLGAKGLASKGLERMTAAPKPKSVAFHETRPPMTAEPVYLKTPLSAKEAAAYLQGSRAALEKHAMTLAEMILLGIPVGAGIGAGVGALRADPGHRGAGALKGGLVGAGIGALPTAAAAGTLGAAYAFGR